MSTATEITLTRFEAFLEGFWWILPNIGIAAIAFLLFLLAASAARVSVAAVLTRRRRPDLAVLLAGFARWVIIALGALTVATIVFPSVRPADVLGALGIGSVALGFAFKDILQNWLAGLLILIRQPFRQGDQIIVKQHEGTVERIEPRATLIKTYDGRRVVIPNSDIYTEAVVVNTAFPRRRSEYDVGIGYGDDVDRACEVMLAALSEVEGVEREPAPEAIPWELAGSTVNIRLRWWTAPPQIDVVIMRGRVIRAVRRALAEAGIDLPFPTRTVLFHDQTEEVDGDRARQREGWPAGRDPPAPRHLNEVAVRRADDDGAADERAPRPRMPWRIGR